MFESVSPSLTWNVLPDRKLLMYLSELPLIPRLVSLSRRPSLSTSCRRPFHKSINTARTFSNAETSVDSVIEL